MLQTERMLKLTVVGPKSKLAATIQACYALNVYHIVEHRKSAELDIGSPLQHAEHLSEILLKLRGLISQLTIKPNGKIARIRHAHKGFTEDDYFRLGQKARTLYEEVSQLLDQRKQLIDQQEDCVDQLKTLKTLLQFGFDPQDLAGTSRFALLVGTVPHAPTLRTQLQAITSRIEITEQPALQGPNAIAIAVDRSKEAAVRQCLTTLGFSEFDHAPLKHLAGTTTTAHAECETLLKRLTEERAVTDRRLAQISRDEEEFLLLNESLLTEEIKKAEAPLKFAATKSGFMVIGWIPKSRLQEVTKTLNQATNQAIHIESAEVHHETEVPIAFKNPKVAQPFQFFLELFTLPNYHEIDPSTLMLFTFPIFFGIMLGDVGYGLVSLALFLFLKRRMPDLKPLMNIMLYAAVVSILFGFAFGEFFGFEHVSAETGEKLCGIGLCLPQHQLEVHGETEVVADFPRLLNRAHGELWVFGYSIPAVLVIGAVIGILHLNLGLFLGFINGWIHHGFLHGLLEKAGWWVIQIAAVLLALPSLGMALPVWVGLLTLLFAAFLLFKGEGIQGLIEMPAIFSNALSYMRLGAVGLASVGLAIVINENFFLPMAAKGGMSLVFGILIMLIGHTINLLLGLIGPFLHALRLHYVEFFTKFYKGGGVPYRPFGVGE